MKNNALKKITIILLILLISLISFVGVYGQSLNRMKNVLPDYKTGMDFGEIREIRFDISENTNTKYYDAEGNEVTEPEEGDETITTELVKVNPDEIRTQENFAKVKEIMTKRLDELGASEYQIRLDENGYISVELPETSVTDTLSEAMYQEGKFEIKDAETNEVLLNNSHISNAFAATSSSSTGAATVYLVINFNEEGRVKLEEISKIYVKTEVEKTADDEENAEITESEETAEEEEEEAETVTKNVLITIDGQTIRNTYFGQTISSGQLQIPAADATTDVSSLNQYYLETRLIANELKFGNLPIVYELSYENTLSSIIRPEVIQVLAISIAILVIIAATYLIVRYNNGVLLSVSWLGFIALFLLLLRFTNAVISMNSIVAILIICMYDYIFLNAVLCNKERRTFDQILTKYCIVGIPMFIIGIVFTFASKTVVSSIGTALFWGSLLIVAYNYVITKHLHDEK